MIIRRKPNKLHRIKMFALCFLLPVIFGIIGNICIKSKIGDKSIEHYAINQIGIYTPSDKYQIEAQAYQQEIEKLKADKEHLSRQLTSRGEVNRTVTEKIAEDKEEFKRDKVIQAIANNLKGAFNEKASFIYDTSKKNNVNPMLMTAIMLHETGNGSSVMCVNNNNPGGISTNTGGFMHYPTLEKGIEAMIKLIKRYYIDEGLTDIQSIGNKYCPLSDSRDTQGLNKYWVPMVTRNYIKILEEAK